MQGSHQDKDMRSDGYTTASQSLSASPTSPNNPNQQPLPSNSSIDSLLQPNIVIQDSLLDYQIALRNHQRLLQRLNHEKEKFVAYQEAEKNNTSFSRWEKLRKKPQLFQEEQETARKSFIKNVQDQLKSSQQNELDSLKSLQQTELHKIKSESPHANTTIKLQKMIKEVDEMERRHSSEMYKMSQLPELRFGEKLARFYDMNNN